MMILVNKKILFLSNSELSYFGIWKMHTFTSPTSIAVSQKWSSYIFDLGLDI